MKWVKFTRQVGATSLGDDVRKTLTIAGLEKAKERNPEQDLRLPAPQTWLVWCASVDRYLRTTVDSSATQPTPTTSTLLCQRVLAVAGEAKCDTCGKVGHFEEVCRQREEGDGKGKVQKGNGMGKKQHTEACYCCGKPGHGKPDCRHRNGTCSTCGRSVTQPRYADWSRAQAPVHVRWSRRSTTNGPWQLAHRRNTCCSKTVRTI